MSDEQEYGASPSDDRHEAAGGSGTGASREDFEQLVTEILFALDDWTALHDGPDVDDAREAVMRELLAHRALVCVDAEVERLRGLVAKAPHAHHCDAGIAFWPGPCNCWKREANAPPPVPESERRSPQGHEQEEK